jgi:ABC-type glutathione transport system ATPase component
MTMMVVTHEMGFARKVAHRILFMGPGRDRRRRVGGAILRRADERPGQELSGPHPPPLNRARAMTQPLLAEASDLAAEARLAASRGVPLVLLYSREDCSWCEKVRRPASRSAGARPQGAGGGA